MSVIDPLGAMLVDPLIDPLGGIDAQPRPPVVPGTPAGELAYVGIISPGETAANVDLASLAQAGIIGEASVSLRWGPSMAGDSLLVMLPAPWGAPVSFYDPDFPVNVLPSFTAAPGARTIDSVAFDAWTFGPMNQFESRHFITIDQGPAPAV